ncbi:DUF4350 domain-containing protein [Halobaculum litoreum]|uniref:DUF4350 domain-containing protein n=1 Tax=Halobaculum litoreum TaxID=3031998 RepID=A0ABD5XPC0_9EURY|nr:DUF4350 domain-containing protein [Halobaculum sp. DT92]
MALGDPEPDPGAGGDGWAPRVIVLVAVAVAVAFVLGGIPGLLSGGDAPASVNTSEYAVDDLSTSQIPASGEIAVPGGDAEGTVVIDRSHANRFTRTEIRPLYQALSRAGYEVVIHDRGDLGPVLANASAFLVVDPGLEYDEADADALRGFADAGGRVVVLGEPNRIVVGGGFGGVTTSERRSALANLAAEFDLEFSTGYVYHQAEHDGFYKNPLADPVGDAAGSGTDVALYTPATVRSTGDGEVVLRARRGARLSAVDDVRPYPVAVRADNVLAVGDFTFATPGRYNVADNERFLSYVVAFMIAGEAPGPETDDGAGAGGDEPTPTGPAPPTGTPAGTPTPSGTPVGTPPPTGTPPGPGTPGT